jgi:hypothetical protein
MRILCVILMATGIFAVSKTESLAEKMSLSQMCGMDATRAYNLSRS